VFKKTTLFLMIATGLMVCQIIATGHVFLSNRAVLEQTSLLTQAGYLSVPNEIVARDLTGLAPAMAGGLFFTLSLGAGLTVLSFLAAWTWIFLFHRSRSALITIAILHLLLLLAVNFKGANLFPSLYIMIVPLTVFVITIRCARPPFQTRSVRFYIFAHAAPLLFLSILWGTQMNDRIFINVRDTLLLSNAFGLKLNAFYYDHTLHAAETFRPIHQKLIKIYKMEPFADQTLEKEVRDQLIRLDYLPVRTEKRVDLEISLDDHGSLLFSRHAMPVLAFPASRFVADADQTLSRISSAWDKNKGFRLITILSLVIGLPLTLYAILYLLIHGGLRLLVDEKKAMIIVSLTSVAIGVMLLVPVFLLETGGPESDKAGAYLASDSPVKRLQALRKINDGKLEITAFHGYREILARGSIPERYWAVRALGRSRDEAAYGQLIRFLDSENINIACMAYHALGMMKEKRAISEIIPRINVSGKWYVQWYAYHALRRLKWSQRGFP
jgi:hypothetical protein